MRTPFLAMLGFVLLTGCISTPAVLSPTASSPSTGAPSTGAPSTSTASTSAPSTSTAPTPAATSVTSTPASSAETPMPVPSVTVTVIEISLKDGKVNPNGDRVALTKGMVLQLKITSDRNDEVHVHGYDVEIPVTAGTIVIKDITLDQVGRFEIESHEPAFTILQLVVS